MSAPQRNSNSDPDSGDEPTLDLENVPVYFTIDELAALDDFFNGSQEMSDDFYIPVGRKLLIAAVKAGLYDE